MFALLLINPFPLPFRPPACTRSRGLSFRKYRDRGSAASWPQPLKEPLQAWPPVLILDHSGEICSARGWQQCCTLVHVENQRVCCAGSIDCSQCVSRRSSACSVPCPKSIHLVNANGGSGCGCPCIARLSQLQSGHRLRGSCTWRLWHGVLCRRDASRSSGWADHTHQLGTERACGRCEPWS